MFLKVYIQEIVYQDVGSIRIRCAKIFIHLGVVTSSQYLS